MRAAAPPRRDLALAACWNNDQTDNTQNVDENLTAENIVSNDVTAIDAVTGDAANMAADVDMNFGNLDDNAADATTSTPVDSRQAGAKGRRRRRQAPAAAAGDQHRCDDQRVGNSE